jgi:signal transduction histidine kinase
LKLLTRSTYYFLLFSTLAILITGVTIYFTIRAVIYKQLDDSLITEKNIIQDQLEDTDTIPDFTATFGHLIEVRLLNYPVNHSQVIKDTIIYDNKSGRHLPFRYIRFLSNTKENAGYIIEIYQSFDENRKLLDNIGMSMFFLFLALLLVSIIVNYMVSKKIWSPFFNAVNKAADFNLLSDKPLELPETEINEFKQLNAIFESMTEKMRADYLNLKEYNENSSHEIQTPLAVIRSKLDILMQTRGLNKKSLDLIRSINEATTRLSKLNQGLLLISKIENMQFPETDTISLKELISNFLNNYKEIMHLRQIRTENKISGPGHVKMNDILADIMISNLISNAIRYNFEGGFIRCELDDKTLTITNSGIPVNISPEQLFKRFSKGTDSSQSIGLGLSIVKKIADYYGMKITYTCTGNIHEIKLTYRP